MNPAFSVIFFTVMSGSGYGLLFLLGLLLAIDTPSIARDEALLALAVGAIFVIAGLLASTLHLGQPQRAWRAFSQWRSSWLSREGVAAVISLLAVAACALALWLNEPALLRVAGGLLTVCALLTVYCTAQIYATLKTIPAWSNLYVMPGYLLFALLSGATLFAGLHAMCPTTFASFVLQWMLSVVIALLAVFGSALKFFYWRFIDTTPSKSTPESATGLGRFGTVRSVEAPHTEENYLTHEMGFALARKHAARLRAIALTLFGAIPTLLALATMLAPPSWAAPGALSAAVSVIAGLFVERWLFFAEAKHVVMLYYGGARP